MPNVYTNCPLSKLPPTVSPLSKKNWYSAIPKMKVVEFTNHFTPASGAASKVSLTASP